MSGTVMKFGPQWIRTLTDGGAPPATSSSSSSAANSHNNNNNNINSTASNSTSSLNQQQHQLQNSSTSSNNNNNNSSNGKYKLAEYRYGREEMLALYEHNLEAPEDIRKYTDLYVEKAHVPMAMTQMSEEEVKLSTRNWNSEAVLRSSTGKMAAAAAAAAGGLGAVSGPTGLSAAGLSGALGAAMSDRDTRQSAADRGAPLSAAGVLSSSPRGPPGSLSRIPIEQRGLLTSMNTRGPTSIRHLVGRGASGATGPNMYNSRSQSHEDENAELDGSGALGSSFENRFGLPGQVRQPNSLRARFETNRTGSGTTTSGGGGLSGTKPIDIKNNGTIDGEPREGRSVFDRLPNKYSLEDKMPRKDINGRMIPGGDWRSRDWSGGGGGSGAAGLDGRDPKTTTDERSWRSARGGTAEDWRSNNSSNNASSSWYVKTDEQRRAGGMNQDNLTSSIFKRDTLRRPSTDEKQGDDDEPNTATQPRHRRDSLPEWSIGDPLSGDKVGSFDASGAFREVARDDGVEHHMNSKDKNHDQANFESKPSGMTSEQEWRAKQQQGYAPNSYNMNEARNFNGVVDSHTLTELEKLTLMNRNNIPGRDRLKNTTASDESRSKQPNRSSPSPSDTDRKKFSNTCVLMNEQRHHQQTNNQNDDDGFAHLERAAECMVAQWTAEEDQDSHLFSVNKANLNAKQHQEALQAEQVASKSFDPNDQKKYSLPFNHEDSQQWFYRDTQHVVQGPFSANEMFEWYKAGYFVKELLVRRACDEVFCPLGEVIKMWERIPFAPVPVNVSPPPPLTPQTILQFRAVTKQLEMAGGMNPQQGQIPPNAFGLTHPGAVLLHGPMLQQQQQQVHQVLAAASLNQNMSNPQEQQAGIRQLLEATRQHDHSLAQQRGHLALDQNEMQTQLRQLLAQLKNREGFSNLNPQEQQEVLVRQFVASRAAPANMPDQEQQALLQGSNALPFLPIFSSNEERLRYQQRLEMDRRQKEEAENQDRFVMEQKMKAEEEKQRIMDEMQNRQRQQKQKEESDKQRQEAERILKLSQLKQLQLAKQQEEFRQQQLHNQQKLQQQQQQQHQQQQQLQQQQEKKHRQQVNQLNAIQQQQQEQQQQIERAKKAAQAQQVQQEQRKPAWSTVSKPEQEPISLATLQKMQEEEKEKERERQRQIQQQIQRQMTWANAAQQPKAAPVKTLAEIQKEEEERLAREKQKQKSKVQATVPNAGVWNNAASHLSWKNPPADS